MTNMSIAQQLEKNNNTSFEKQAILNGLKNVSVDKVRDMTLACIQKGEYNLATQTLKNFLNSDFVYTNYKLKIEKYISYSIDIVLALEANKNYAGYSSLTRAKQQELRTKYKRHLDELTGLLNKIQLVYMGLKFKDNQSTQYVVKSVWISAVIVFAGLLTIDFFTGIASTAYILLDNGIDQLSQIISKLI